MKAAIFSFVKVSPKSMVASVRVAQYVQRLLGVPLIDDGTIAQAKPRLLIIINGAFAFCSCLEELGTAVQAARKVVWIQQDYTIVPPINDGSATSPFRRAFTLRRERGLDHLHLWTTVPEKIAPGTLGTYCNWNCLTLDTADDWIVAKRRAQAGNDLYYYGSYRAGRVKDFDRFFIDPKLETHISSPSKKFAERYPQCGHHGKIEGDFYAQLGLHGMGLYIEDRWSHKHYCSPANRFYEMLSAGLPMLFQPECASMLRRAGYDPAPYTADGARKVPALMAKRETIGEEQRARWLPLARKERQKLDSAVIEAYEKMEKAI